MDNSKFRAFALKKPEEKAAAPAAMSAEERARKKEKQQASYERRMAIQKRREEALAEASRYVDRAAERRKDATKESKESGRQNSFYDEQEQKELEEARMQQVANTDGPTFAQLGEREDLSQQQHRVSITQSKYLGGDIEHTHLVKGLDFALLQKTRAELTAAQVAQAKKEDEDAAKRAARQKQLGGGGGAANSTSSKAASNTGGGAAAKLSSSSKSGGGAGISAGGQGGRGRAPSAIGEGGEGGGGKVTFNSEFARDVHRAIFREAARPNRALAEGRLVLIFDTLRSDSSSDVPSSLVRSHDDLSGPARSAADKVGCDPQLPGGLLSRLGKVAAYVAGGGRGGLAVGGSGGLTSGGGGGGKKSKKEKGGHGGEGSHASGAPSVLTLKPLVRRPEAEAGAAARKSRWGGQSGAADDAGGWTSSQSPSAAAPGSAAAAASTLPASSSSKPKLGEKAPPAPPPKPVEDDVDDIFGDVGSDYVCQPSAAQLKKAVRDSADAKLVRGPGGKGGHAPMAAAAMDDDEDDDERVAPPLAIGDDEGGDGAADVTSLLKRALAKGGRLAEVSGEGGAKGGKASKRLAAGEAAMEVVAEDEDMDDAALLQASKGKAAGSKAPKGAGKDLKMGAMDDSYDELFPDTYQGYANALQLGPDEDDEHGIVRSKDPKEGEEADSAAGGGGKGGKGKRGGGVDVEALKQKAKEDRDLAAIEKLMEERAHKRQRRDEGAGGSDGGAGGVDQNEMF